MIRASDAHGWRGQPPPTIAASRYLPRLLGAHWQLKQNQKQTNKKINRSQRCRFNTAGLCTVPNQTAHFREMGDRPLPPMYGGTLLVSG